MHWVVFHAASFLGSMILSVAVFVVSSLVGVPWWVAVIGVASSVLGLLSASACVRACQRMDRPVVSVVVDGVVFDAVRRRGGGLDGRCD